MLIKLKVWFWKWRSRNTSFFMYEVDVKSIIIVTPKKLREVLTLLKWIFSINLLHLQNKSISEDSKIFVLNTSILWGLDYFGKDKFDEYNKIEFD